MARRHSSRLSGLLIPSLLVAACTVGNPAAPTIDVPDTTTTAPSTTTTTTPSTTTTTASTTTTLGTTTTSLVLPDIDAEVDVPDGEGPFPAVVLVHGGGWIAGDSGLMRPLARHLNEAGFLTVNTVYALANDSPGFPSAMEDVACAVRYAAAHPDSDGTVALIGHSAGAHISAVVALTGDRYDDDCPVPGSGLPDKLIGLAGPYDVARLGVVMLPFFGSGPSVDPEAWQAGNPQLLTDENPDLKSLIMYGGSDGLVDPSFSIDFHEALLASGSDSLLEPVEEARHNQMRDPDWVGDLIVVWLER